MIRLKNLTKDYKRYQVSYHSLKNVLLHFKQRQQLVAKIDTLHVVSNLNLDIQASEILCITGPNGAGKSTLAKLIAGTVEPTHGSIEVLGKIVPFLELGIAFSPELTGIDNLYLNGVLLGLSLRFLRANKAKVFEFAGLSDFMNTPLKYYSSGMKLRLGFSIAMHAEGDIYIFDEILAVGDETFRKKCFAAFDRLIQDKKTIIIITHDFEIIKKHATRLLVLANEHHYVIDDIEQIHHIDEIDSLMQHLQSTH